VAGHHTDTRGHIKGDGKMATTRIASGRTQPGSTAWQQYPNGAGVFVDINTTAARLTGTPVYVTSIGGNSHHWATTGATSVYLATATGFRVFVRWSDGNPLTPDTANGFQWHINWIAMEV
jgi:hypothetical protein